MCFNIPIMLFWYYVIKKRKEVIKAGNKLDTIVYQCMSIWY